MALIEVYHVIADMYPIAAVTADDETNWIREGMVVTLSHSGQVIRAVSDPGRLFLGLAGDSTIPATGVSSQSPARGLNTPYSDPLIINGQGTTAFTQNRVSDPVSNETAASGLVTIYHGGGKFWTSMFEPPSSTGNGYNVGTELYASATAGFLGMLTNVIPNAGAPIVGICVAEPQEYSSGVPGTQTSDGSMSLGEYLCITLRH